MTESDPLNGLGTGTLIWLGLSNLVALFVGDMEALLRTEITYNQKKAFTWLKKEILEKI
jgi:hypothetical protein